MRYYSTRNKLTGFSFREVLLKGLASDGGIFVPEYFPKFTQDELEYISNLTFNEIAYLMSKKFIENEIKDTELNEILSNVFTFSPKLIQLENNLFILELFHGPTLAFKDFGARFMASLMSYFASKDSRKLTILVATSGDTGSAVANAFYQKDGIEVYILYPSGMVSDIQEKQLTTYGSNITAVEILGTFDDCQRLVKTAFLDLELNQKKNLTSANSINIGRLIPQSFYYIYAAKNFKDENINFIVPSGNLGNLTAGLYASSMGLNNISFISALNSNNMFYEFLETGIKQPKNVIKTISNAMDVGNPSNLERILDMFQDDRNEIQKKIISFYFDDYQTKKAIKECYTNYNYVLDPHGAVAFLAGKSYKTKFRNKTAIILETAHPAKFKEIVENVIEEKIEIPSRLQEALKKEKMSVVMSNNFSSLKEFLLSRI